MSVYKAEIRLSRICVIWQVFHKISYNNVKDKIIYNVFPLMTHLFEHNIQLRHPMIFCFMYLGSKISVFIDLAYYGIVVI